MTSLFDTWHWKRQGSIFIMILLLSGCTELRMQTLPAPPVSTKLRVFVQPLSESLPKGTWRTAHEIFAEKMYEETQKMLNEKGIYEVVPEKDVRTVIGNQSSAGWQWERNEWLLARQVGKALYADYTLIIERGQQTFFYNRMVLINTETGKNFQSFKDVQATHGRDSIPDEHKKVIRLSFGDIFNLAKADMLSTAMRKGKVIMSTDVTGSGSVEKKGPPLVEEALLSRQPLSITKEPTRPIEKVSREKEPDKAAVQKPSLSKTQESSRMPSREVRDDNEISGRGKTKLVVYDFNAVDNLRVVAMILAEALREELYQSGKFELINRENISQVMDELKLQQTGLVDEKDAIRMGKWMSANETVTGNLAMLGNALILQAKRTDMVTMATLSLDISAD